MSACPESGRLQDFLEALLPEPDLRAMRDHVAGCASCGAERVRLERLFDAFERLPLESPSPALRERVLDSVLPARRRARWMRRLGVGYAAALVASLGGAAVVAMLPAGRGFLAWLAGNAPARVLDSLGFLVNAVSFVALRLAGGWGLVSEVGFRASPLLRALFTAVDQPVVELTLALSAATCLAVVGWMRSRADRRGGGMPNVGLLGF